MRFLVGLLLMVGGYFVTWKADWLLRNFGSIPMFDKYLKTAGGGRLGYKLIGIGFIFAGVMAITNLHVNILTKIAQLLSPGV
jgi:hypothetical protein